MNTQLTLCDAYTIAADDDHCALRIVKTGWKDKYHVIIEDAVYGSKMLSDPLTAEEIELKYGHKLPEPMDIHRKIKNTPNDYDLGEAFRSLALSLKK